MRVLVTGATGFLGSRATTFLRAQGHDVLPIARPEGATRAARDGIDGLLFLDAGDPQAQDAVSGRDAVLHFAGVPDPRRAREDPAEAVRANAGTTLNLLEASAHHGATLVYPSSVRTSLRAPDAYAASKRLGEEACRMHTARSVVVRLPSVFGPGQVAREGATGAIAAFAARALAGEPIVIPGNPRRTRDFVYVDDLLGGLARLLLEEDPPRLVQVGSGRSTALVEAAEIVRAAAGSSVPVKLPGGELAPDEDRSYATDDHVLALPLACRPLEEGIAQYVDWLRRHPSAQGRARA